MDEAPCRRWRAWRRRQRLFGSRRWRAATPASGYSPGPEARVKVWSAPKGSPSSGGPGGPLLPTSISRRLLWDRPGWGPIRASRDSCRPGAGRVGPGIAGVVESCGADSPARGGAAAAGADDAPGQTTRVQGAGAESSTPSLCLPAGPGLTSPWRGPERGGARALLGQRGRLESSPCA